MTFKAREWSSEEDEWLIDQLAYLTLAEICEELGVSPPTAIKRIKALGYKKPRVGHSPKTPKEMIVCTCKNPLCNDAFEESVYRVERGGGQYCSRSCSCQARRIQVPTKEVLQKDYDEGLSTNDLARRYEISSGTIYNLFRLYGITARTLSESQSVPRVASKRMARNGIFRGGFRPDLDIVVRSQWEADILRWLNHQQIAWTYEPNRFYFPTEKRGAKSYLPDIWLPDHNGGTWIEIKGRLMSSDKTRIKRFKKYYIEEFDRLVAIPGSPKTEAAEFFTQMDVPTMAFFNELNREFKGVIPHWGE